MLRTRSLLRAALLAECARRPLAEVSVADLVRRAGIGRTTFYLHYADLDALAVDSCAGMVDEAVEALHAWDPLPDPVRPPVELTGLLGRIAANAELYRSLLMPGGGGPLGTVLHRQLRQRAISERRRRGLGTAADEVVASAVAASFAAVLADWLHERISATPDQLAGRLWPLLVALHRAG
ncbi:MAG TPA: TetR family transcriptional regulator [Pseudonocardiaceae bacterium]|nr:TetR family transcriptional regulator [Pseudonocardiaceae bacterium]